jgi:PAS domain S-box-containing protein
MSSAAATQSPQNGTLASVEAKLQVLLVEDNAADAELVVHELRRDGFEVTSRVVKTPEDFRAQLHATLPDVVLADYNLGHWRGMDALTILREEGLDIPLILVSGTVGEATAVDCIKEGATDYVLKNQLTRLPSSLGRAMRESALREQRKRSDAALLEHKYALDQHAIVATTDVHGTITYANDMFCAISKYSRDELLGQNHRILNSGHHSKEFFQQMYHTIANGQVWHGEMRNRAKDGSIYWVDATIVPFLDTTGKPRQYMAIRTDITERKRAEQNLARKADELARSNADLEQFAYVASHDLQEPLRMVAAYTQLLAERYRGRLDENADKFIGYASEGALRMQVLIQDLLAFSRTGRRETSNVSVDCNPVLQEVLQTMSSSIEESHAVITHQELPVIWADRTQMAQVFQNLIGNAIKFHREVPPVISIRAEKADQHWLFSVSDNGIGISAEDAGSIFVVFHRLHTRSEYPGNGIGLAICKKIIERGGGKIWVESQAGSGCTFRFTVPLRSPDTPEGATT